MPDVRPGQTATISRLVPFARDSSREFPGHLTSPSPTRVAVVHDWCPDFRGGERVLARICAQFPGADVFTLFDFLPPAIKEQYFRDVAFHASFLNNLPMVRKFYRSLFFLCPFMIEQFDVTGYDLVVSSSAAFARGVLTRPDQPHLCYVHSPIRYAWDEQFNYLEQGRLGFGPKGLLFRYLLHGLRTWDTRTAHGPDLMLANSSYVQARIRHTYGRSARVVHPPIETDELRFVARKSDYYVTASYLAPYKRIDLVIRAFNEMPDLPLVVVGDGQQSKALKAIAGPNIKFAGFLPRAEYVDTIANAKAMVFAGCEDFGIAMAEAQACGTPLIAFGRGGACDIVRALGVEEDPTGILFDAQTVDALKGALLRFQHQGQAIAPLACRANAARFSTETFDAAIRESAETVRQIHRSGYAPQAA